MSLVAIRWALLEADKKGVAGCLANVIEDILDGTLFGFALMLLEIRLELLFSLFGVDEKLRARAEGQLANIAVCHAGGAADKSYNLEIPVRHPDIIAGTHC